MKVSLFILSVLFYLSKGTAQDIKYPFVKTSEIKNFKLEEGVYNASFKMTNGKHWDMKITVPKIQPDKTYPLILALHWAGDGLTYNEYSTCLAFPGTSNMNAIVVAPSGGGAHWINPLNEKRVIDMVKKIKKQWPVDKDKILITGYSNGAIGSWEYAKKYPKLFSAAIAISGYYNVYKIKIPVYVLHGANDELFDKNKVAIAVQNSRKKGSTISFEILPNLSHYMACYYVDALKKTMEKIKTEVWDE